MNKHSLSERAKEKVKKINRILKSTGKSNAQLEQEQTVTLTNTIADKRLFEEATLQTSLTIVREDASTK